MTADCLGLMACSNRRRTHLIIAATKISNTASFCCNRFTVLWFTFLRSCRGTCSLHQLAGNQLRLLVYEFAQKPRASSPLTTRSHAGPPVDAAIAILARPCSPANRLLVTTLLMMKGSPWKQVALGVRPSLTVYKRL